MVTEKVMKELMAYSWPGNIRELINVIERAIITNQGGELRFEIPDQPHASSTQGRILETVEKEHIFRVLEDTYWKIEGPSGAAEILGLTPSTLRHRMKKLGLQRPKITT